MTRIRRTILSALMTCISVTALVDARHPQPDELTSAMEWSKQHLESEVATPPFSFTRGGQPSSELLKSWRRTASSKTLDDHRTQHILTWADPQSRMEVR